MYKVCLCNCSRKKKLNERWESAKSKVLFEEEPLLCTKLFEIYCL